MKLIIAIFYWGAIVIIGGLSLLLTVQLLPIDGNYRVLSVLSGSMEPEISTGSAVIVAPATNYKIGDIITFGEGGKTKMTITHRINEINETDGRIVYATKGDSNNTPDRETVPAENVIGKVWFSIPHLGYLIDFIRKPGGFFAVIFFPVAWIIFDEIKKIVRELRTPKTVKPPLS